MTMEKQAVMSLYEYQAMMEELDQLRKMKQAKLTIICFKRYYPEGLKKKDDYEGVVWHYFIDKEELPDVSRELAEELEKTKKTLDEMYNSNNILAHKISVLQHKIEWWERQSNSREVKENKSKEVKENKNSSWFDKLINRK